MPWIAALLTAALYLPTLSYGFLLDDFVLFQTSASLQEAGSIARGFTHDLGAVRHGGDTVDSSYYRPVFLALSTLYYQAVGGNPQPWHAAAVALAALIAALACRFLARQGVDDRLALPAALVFALHPAHVSSVAWAAGLQELTAACFILAALLFAEGSRTRDLALAGVAFAAAVLCKEVALALVLWSAWVAWEKREGPGAARRWKTAGMYTAIAALYLAARVAVLGGLAVPPQNAPSLGRAIAAIPVALTTYAKLLIAPIGFSFFRPERPPADITSLPVLVATALLAAGALLAVWVGRRRPELVAPMVWMLVWLLPVLNFWALDPQFMVTDRYLFLPALGLAWLLARLVQAQDWPPRLGPALLFGLALAFALLSLRYEAIFRDERRFLAAMERAEPTNTLIHAHKGNMLRRNGNRSGARAAFERVLELDATMPHALIALGEMELEAGDFASAEDHFRKSLVVRPHASRGFKSLTLALARSGQRDAAFVLADETATRWPEDFQAKLIQAVFLAARDRRPEAEAAFAAARALKPNDASIAGGFDATLAALTPSFLPVYGRRAPGV